MSILRFRVWDKERKLYVPPFDTELRGSGCLFVNGGIADKTRYETELWTGQEDETGRFIYENDELEAPNGNRSIVVWKNGRFVLESGDEISSFYSFKVVGRK